MCRLSFKIDSMLALLCGSNKSFLCVTIGEKSLVSISANITDQGNHTISQGVSMRPFPERIYCGEIHSE